MVCELHPKKETNKKPNLHRQKSEQHLLQNGVDGRCLS